MPGDEISVLSTLSSGSLTVALADQSFVIDFDLDCVIPATSAEIADTGMAAFAARYDVYEVHKRLMAKGFKPEHPPPRLPE